MAVYNFGVTQPPSQQSPRPAEQPIEMVTLPPPVPEAVAQPIVAAPPPVPIAPPADTPPILQPLPSEPVAEALPTAAPPVAADPPPQTTQTAPVVPPPVPFRSVTSVPPAKPLRHIAQVTQKLQRQDATLAPPAVTSAQAPVVAATSVAAAPVVAATDAEARLEARVRDAVQNAVNYPPAARMMGLTGRARVLLDYHSGLVDNPTLAQSSGASMLDSAALAAAREAHYPKPPPGLEGQLLRFLVWVEFRTG